MARQYALAEDAVACFGGSFVLHLADEFSSIIPKILPSVSLQYAWYTMPDIAILGVRTLCG